MNELAAPFTGGLKTAAARTGGGWIGSNGGSCVAAI